MVFRKATELRNICRNQLKRAQKVHRTETVCESLFRYSVPLLHFSLPQLQILRSSAALRNFNVFSEKY